MASHIKAVIRDLLLHLEVKPLIATNLTRGKTVKATCWQTEAQNGVRHTGEHRMCCCLLTIRYHHFSASNRNCVHNSVN